MPFVFVADVALFYRSFGSFSYIFVFKIQGPEESYFMVVVKYIIVFPDSLKFTIHKRSVGSLEKPLTPLVQIKVHMPSSVGVKDNRVVTSHDDHDFI